MRVDLLKGQKVDLTNGYPGLNKLVISLRWETNNFDDSYDFELDIDSAAFQLKTDGEVASVFDDFIFYGYPKHPSGSVEYADDGASSNCKTFKVDLSCVPGNIERIAFTLAIYDAAIRKQNLGQIKNAYIHVIDMLSYTELARYNFGGEFTVETAVVVGELCRNNNEWRFSAIGRGLQGDLNTLCHRFGINF